MSELNGLRVQIGLGLLGWVFIIAILWGLS